MSSCFLARELLSNQPLCREDIHSFPLETCNAPPTHLDEKIPIGSQYRTTLSPGNVSSRAGSNQYLVRNSTHISCMRKAYFGHKSQDETSGSTSWWTPLSSAHTWILSDEPSEFGVMAGSLVQILLPTTVELPIWRCARSHGWFWRRIRRRGYL